AARPGYDAGSRRGDRGEKCPRPSPGGAGIVAGMAAVLQAERLVKVFRGTRAVDGVDLRVHGGERVALLGPNGAGKTTTLLMLLGVITPDAGTVELMGQRLPAGRSSA